MGIAKLYGQKASGTNINGIIKDYHAYAGENISAGDLVEYINGIAGQVDCGTSPLTQFSNNNKVATIRALTLDNDRVFLFYSRGTSYQGTAVIVKIEGATISLGTSVVFNSGQTTQIDICKVEANKILLVFQDGSNSSYGTAIVANVSDSSITFGSKVVFNKAVTNSMFISLVEANKVLAIYADNGNSSYGTSILLSVSGTTVTYGSEYVFESTSANAYMTLSKIESYKFLLMHGYNGSSFPLRFRVCNVSGSSITFGSYYQPTRDLVGCRGSCSLVAENKLIFSFGDYSNSYYGTSMVVNVTGNTLTFGTKYVYFSGECYDNQNVSIGINKVLITYREYADMKKAHTLIATIKDDIITYLTSSMYTIASTGNMYELTCVIFDNNRFINFYYDYGNSSYGYLKLIGLNGNLISDDIIVDEYETQVRKTTTSQFDGVAKEVAETYDTVLVQEDIIPKTWTEVTVGTEYIAEDGTELTASSYRTDTNSYAYYACSNAGTSWQSNPSSSVTSAWLQLKFAKSIKITKIKLNKDYNGSHTSFVKIQGSNNGIEWVDLYICSDEYSGTLEEITLTSSMYAQYYRIYSEFDKEYSLTVTDWQVSEYEAIEKGKDLVSIYTLPQYEYAEFTSNPAPTSWDTQIVAYKEYESSNDLGIWRIQASSVQQSNVTKRKVIYAFDGTETDAWQSNTDTPDGEYIAIYLPEGIEIKPKVIDLIYENLEAGSSIQGLNMKTGEWEDIVSLERAINQINLTCSVNTNYYGAFKIRMLDYSTSYHVVYNFQITEGTIRKVIEI